MLKLWLIDFDTTSPLEFDGCTVMAAEQEPSMELAQEVVPVHGSIYINKISEVKEADIRNISPKRVIYLDK